jgi:hypothetical protein
MPIDYRIDDARRLVSATITGTLTDDEVFDYQRTVWLKPAVSGYDELIDMAACEHVAIPAEGRIRDLAEVSAGMDARDKSALLAIVAPQEQAFLLGQMYRASRGLAKGSAKVVNVFRTRGEAEAWLAQEGSRLRGGAAR